MTRAKTGLRIALTLAAGMALTAGAAEVSVSGLGWWRNREMRQSLERLHDEKKDAALDAVAVEDMAFVLIADLESRGYQRPTVRVSVTPEGGGAKSEYVFDAELDTLLPRPTAAAAVSLRAEPGVHYRLNSVEFTGLVSVEEAKARSYFQPWRMLPLAGADERAYSPDRLRRSESALSAALLSLGHAQAAVNAEVLRIDDASGEVDVRVSVDEGPKWVVTALTTRGFGEGVEPPGRGEWESRPWSAELGDALADDVRRAHYRRGYADARVKVVPEAGAPIQNRRLVTVGIVVEAGPKVRVGEVRFEGNARTSENLLRRRARVDPGEPLDPPSLDRARQRLGRLGVFSQVDLEYGPAGAEVRDVVFSLEEAPRVDARLLMGYGSYEQLRGGVELTQTNLWGLAHHSRLELIQSFKSSQGDYTYSLPGLFGEAFDGAVRGYGLRREEQSFTREEFGGELTARRQLRRWGLEATAGYSYESLTNVGNELTTRTTDDGTVKVASLNFGLSQDRRDHPLQPHEGWRWFSQFEFAEREFGGEVDYQRWQLGASWHQGLGAGRWLHVGLQHNGVATFGFDEDVPVNKRFYPGGESSIRGYQNGEASPRGADGRFVGAETFVLMNVEVEQALTRRWSLVVFWDGLGMAENLRDYPFDEELHSVGIGIRYNTLIGPLRVEYGHNLNPRPGDPDGTLHFSIGFPF